MILGFALSAKEQNMKIDGMRPGKLPITSGLANSGRCGNMTGKMKNQLEFLAIADSMTFIS